MNNLPPLKLPQQTGGFKSKTYSSKPEGTVKEKKFIMTFRQYGSNWVFHSCVPIGGYGFAKTKKKVVKKAKKYKHKKEVVEI